MAGVTRAYLFNTALPLSSVPLFANGVVPSFDNSDFEVHCSFTTSGKLSVTRTYSGVTVESVLNGDVALVAGATYTFDISTSAAVQYNLKYSAGTGTIQFVKINEIAV